MGISYISKSDANMRFASLFYVLKIFVTVFSGSGVHVLFEASD